MLNIIKEKTSKIKNFCIENSKSNIIFFILLLIFSTSCAYFLGKISVYEKINKEEYEKSIFLQKNIETNNITYVSSKKGKVFYFPWCSGAIRLKKENKIFFDNREEAIKKGYRPAKNCEGL